MARVLIAEDDDILADMLAEAFIGSGHGVGILANGDEAYRAIREMAPDIAILDQNLPGRHGIDILKAIRVSSHLWHMPVMMLTQARSRDDETIALYEGANRYLRKPCEPDFVVLQVEELLKGGPTYQLNRRSVC